MKPQFRRYRMKVLSILSLLFRFSLAASQICRDQSSCNNCLQHSQECVWCNNQNYTGSNCFERNATSDVASCGEQYIVNLISNLTVISNDEDVGSASQLNSSETIVNPEQVYLSTRANQVHRFNVSISIPFNYPLDFYYLMDFSCSMFDDLQTIQDLSPEIINTLESLTSNFKVGFGAFSDKETLPFTHEILEPFCADASIAGVSEHSSFNYIHYQSLTSNRDVFLERIKQLNITSNLDSPESTLEALMQAVVCTEVIGWRPTASHIVLLATDAPYHIAGDGKLTGALLPHDMKCHLSQLPDDTYQYDESLDLDYPSIGQIQHVMLQERIVPIFAIASNRSIEHFKDMREQLQLTSYIDELNPSSANILDLIREGYNSLAQNIELLLPTDIEGVNILVRPLCDQTSGVACTNIARGETASFEVSIEVTDCAAAQRKQNITLRYPFLAVSIDVELEVLCDCDCAMELERNSTTCNYRGDFVCARCQCDNTRGFGRSCECELEEGDDPNKDQGNGNNRCPIGLNNLMCSGNGNCTCNKCECKDDFEGDACENQCICANGCGGVSNGRCVCGRERNNPSCMCMEPFEGKFCNCTKDTSTCTANIEENIEANIELCSGNGACNCGACDCNDDCRGALCDRCQDQLMCQLHRACVQCELVRDGKANVVPPNDCDNSCKTSRFVDPVNTTTTHTINGFTANRCSFTDNSNCFYTFYVALNDDFELQTLEIENMLRCSRSSSSSTSALIWIIPVAIVVGLLVLGFLILLLIKVFLLILDYVEVRQFERSVRDAEGKLAQTSQPLYQSPVVQYQNLAYGIEKKENK